MSHIKFEDVIASPFAQNRSLLKDISPGSDPIDMTIGEPRHAMPDFVKPILAEKNADFGRYPPIRGTEGLRNSLVKWHQRRYSSLVKVENLSEMILPLNGTREGLFSAAFTAVNRKNYSEKPAFLMPNPFYQVYLAGALAAGGEPIYLSAKEENNFLPDLNTLSEETLQRTAAFYICSPSNPEGAIATENYLKQAIELARKYDFLLFSDECYSEIYQDTPPPGALETAWSMDKTFRNVVSFNSLSKRSNLPGLRSGFMAGDPDFIESAFQFRNVACPQVPLPVQHVSEQVWADENHVEINRELYREKFLLTKQLVGSNVSIRIPSAGIFLWLNMRDFGGGEKTTARLWKECGVKVLPGSFLAHQDSDGYNPGADYIRIALVQDLETTEEALKRFSSIGLF